jgi:hypothetical protein
MRINAAYLTLLGVFLGGTDAFAQDQNEAERVVEAFFQSGNTAPWEAMSSCPGEDARKDSIMVALTRPRPEQDTRRLVTAWGSVPECRKGQVLAWSEQATRIIVHDSYARALAWKVLALDSVAGLAVLQRAAADPLVPVEARGGYQIEVFWRLSLAEQEDLFIETFRQGLQVGDYPNMSLGNLLFGPDAGDRAARLVSAVMDHAGNERATYVLGTVLGSVTAFSRERFSHQERLRIWAIMEPRVGSLPPDMRRIIESHEAELKRGPG